MLRCGIELQGIELFAFTFQYIPNWVGFVGFGLKCFCGGGVCGMFVMPMPFVRHRQQVLLFSEYIGNRFSNVANKHSTQEERNWSPTL